MTSGCRHLNSPLLKPCRHMATRPQLLQSSTWDISRKYLPRTQGVDEYYGILYSTDMHPVQLVKNEEVVQYPVLQTELNRDYTSRAIDFIKRNRDQPFFLYLPHAMPHKPLAASWGFLHTQHPKEPVQ